MRCLPPVLAVQRPAPANSSSRRACSSSKVARRPNSASWPRPALHQFPQSEAFITGDRWSAYNLAANLVQLQA